MTSPEPGEEVAGKYGHLLPDIPPGDNYLFYTDKRGHPEPRWRGKYWSFLLKLAPDKPSPTIQAQPGPYIGPFHWENRRLRVAEVKRLFTYPDDFELVGSRSAAQSQLGNSVPPLLAEKVLSCYDAAADVSQEMKVLGMSVPRCSIDYERAKNEGGKRWPTARSGSMCPMPRRMRRRRKGHAGTPRLGAGTRPGRG